MPKRTLGVRWLPGGEHNNNDQLKYLIKVEQYCRTWTSVETPFEKDDSDHRDEVARLRVRKFSFFQKGNVKEAFISPFLPFDYSKEARKRILAYFMKTPSFLSQNYSLIYTGIPIPQSPNLALITLKKKIPGTNFSLYLSCRM